ncbi:hypothetical protein I5H06_gp42 [Mycobacterium phage SirPhilip]|uniref:Uncharacterized protein n=1 Tax=Mycobacterium phage SirPhilip TaxID=2015824 RepID=A0A222ZLU3_9CAUD|nr:hypothetical protein I5H06_gp42 [Mycobacterium phage SirPhilip]ASR85262.1 hypothetical protein SEA_SIRPHILIP_60 [Mycobacterium phage SirPhilip]
MSNFVHVGKVQPADPRRDDRVLTVGVRADLGEVMVSVDGRNQPVPPLTPEQAKVLAGRIERAAAVASSLAEAYRSYQAALQEAEDTLAQAFSREVGA